MHLLKQQIEIRIATMAITLLLFGEMFVSYCLLISFNGPTKTIVHHCRRFLWNKEKNEAEERFDLEEKDKSKSIQGHSQRFVQHNLYSTIIV